MAADFFKMRTIIGLVFCVLVISGKMVIVQSAVYSSPDIALKFSECLVEKLSQSQSFSYEEVNSILEVRDVMAQSLLNSGKSSSTFTKSVAIALVTSLANLIILDDVSKNTYRKQNYASALEQCLLWTTGDPDTEFLNEALRILSIIENNRAAVYEETSASGSKGNPTSGTFDSSSVAQTWNVDSSLAVQPSPVQNFPVTQHFYSIDKTDFVQRNPNFENPYFPSSTSIAQAPVNSQYEIQPASQIGFSPGFATGTQVENFPSGFDVQDTSQVGEFSSGFISSPQSRDFFVVSDASRMTQLGPSFSGSETFPSDYDRISITNDRPVVSSYNESPQIWPINVGGNFQTSYEGLSIPQTKESSVVVIPPKLNEQFVPDKDLTQNPQRGAEYDDSGQFYPQPEVVEKLPQDYNIDESVYSEFSEKEADFDFGSAPLSPEDRKNEIFSIALAEYLSKSEAFRNFFCGESAREDKVEISHSIIKSSVTDYGSHVASLAASIASSALSELSDEGLCNNYATTISEIIAEILEENDIDDANAETVASKMELNLKQRQIIPTEPQYYAPVSDDFPQRIPETETYAAEQKLESSFETTKEFSSRNEKQTKHPNLDTQSDTNGVSDYAFTNPMTTIYRSTNLPTTRPDCTAQPKESPDWAPDGAVDEEALADYLTEAFYDVKSHISEETEAEESNGKETSSTVDIIENDSGYSTEEFNDQTLRKQKDQFTTLQSDIVTTSVDQSQYDEEDYDPSITEDEDTDFYEDQTGTLQEDSADDNIKISPVELQPSFQGPESKSENTNIEFQPNSDTISYDSYFTDPRIEFSRKVSEIADYSIAHIRSQNFDLGTMCTHINQLAPLVDVLALDYCEPIAAVDYILNVLEASVKILQGEQRNKFITLQSAIVTTSVDQSQKDYISDVGDASFYHQDKTTSPQEDSSGFNIKTSPVELQPSFQYPLPNSEYSNVGYQPNSDTTPYDSQDADPTIEFSNKVLDISESSRNHIRSQNFELGIMCAQINQLAPIVGIPALDYCEPVAAVDYVLNVLRVMIRILGEV